MPEHFLNALGLPGAWAAQRSFTLLDIAPACWQNFFETWAQWHADPARPARLHYVVLGVDPPAPLAAPTPASALSSTLAAQLAAALWGLLPGFHRLAFNDGQVLLTVCVGNDLQALLREQAFAADAVFVNNSASTDLTNAYTLKAIARRCRRGTRVAGDAPAGGEVHTPGLLARCGFDVAATPAGWHGQFNPAWPVTPTERQRAAPARFAGAMQSFPAAPPSPPQPGHCLVVGAGLAGTAVAASLARRGWRVSVLDAAAAVASGASGLPAGIVAPHISPDDSPLSRLSRAGIRITLQQAAALLHVGQDFSPTGVLERCLDHARRRPASWLPGGQHADAAHDWVRNASPAQLAACGLPVGDADGSAALWHAKAGWVKPAELARAWLATPGVTWHGHCDVARLEPTGDGWQALDSAGTTLAQGDLVVLAAGHATAALVGQHAAGALPLQPIRGQVSWALQAEADSREVALPDFPVNGHGHWLGGVPLGAGGTQPAWLMGASYERDVATAIHRPEDNTYNTARLHRLLPGVATQLGALLHGNAGALQAWAGVRCATPTRLPWVGPVAGAGAGLWVCCGMGSRGLTFAALCAELLAAQLHDEPWPVEKSLATAFAPRIAVKPKT